MLRKKKVFIFIPLSLFTQTQYLTWPSLHMGPMASGIILFGSQYGLHEMGEMLENFFCMNGWYMTIRLTYLRYIWHSITMIHQWLVFELVRRFLLEFSHYFLKVILKLYHCKSMSPGRSGLHAPMTFHIKLYSIHVNFLMLLTFVITLKFNL